MSYLSAPILHAAQGSEFFLFFLVNLREQGNRIATDTRHATGHTLRNLI